MSAINVKRQITGPILRALAKDVANDRKTFEKQLGQVFIFEPAKIRNLIKDLASQFELQEPSRSDVSSAIEEIRRTLVAREQNFRKVYGAKVDKIKKSIETPLNRGDQIFVIRSFRVIQELKRGPVVRIVAAAFKKANSDKQATLGSNKFKFGITGFGSASGFHVGHGELGTPVSGLAVSRSVARLDKLINDTESTRAKAKLEEIRSQIVIQVNDSLDVDIPYELLITKDGKFRRNFAPILSFQDARENIRDSVADKRIKQIVTEVMGAIDHANFEGSTSIKQGLEQVTLYNLQGKNRKVVGTKKAIVQEKGRTKDSKKGKSKIKANAQRSNLFSTELESALTQPTAGQPISSASLVQLINSRLQTKIIENMGEPGLVNRTGRFAGSVQVLDISFTKNGFPSIGYTYQDDPYAIFEDGPRGKRPWANTNRDPRSVIDRSIREIAAEFLQGRFYTRRL